jgi:hypothetical protein
MVRREEAGAFFLVGWRAKGGRGKEKREKESRGRKSPAKGGEMDDEVT